MNEAEHYTVIKYTELNNIQCAATSQSFHQQILSVWLAQLLRALAAPTHVRSCVQEVRVRSPERTSLTLASIPSG